MSQNIEPNGDEEQLNIDMIEFQGANPTKRRELPKLRTNKNSNIIQASANAAFDDHIANNSLVGIHTLVYCEAMATSQLHKQQGTHKGEI